MFTKTKVRVSKIAICVFIGLFIWGGQAAAADNLLQNGSFESGASGWKQDLWNHGDTYSQLSIADDVSRSGNSSAYIESFRDNDAKWTQEVDVEPETLYRLSGWILAENIAAGGVGANLSVLGSWDTPVDVFDTEGEWQYVELYGRTQIEQQQMTVAIRLGGYGSLNTGRAWFDDIVVEKVDVAPAGVQVANFYPERPLPGAEEAEEAPVTTGTPFKLIGYALVFFLLYSFIYIAFIRRDAMAGLTRRQLQAAVLLLLAAGLLIRLLIAPVTSGYVWDINTFKAWAAHAVNSNLVHFYNTDMFVDYPPGYIYILYILGLLQNLFQLASDSQGLLLLMKLPAILADIATAWLLFRMAEKRVRPGTAFAVAALYVFNPAVLVNSTIWGQVDSFFVFFLLIAINAISKGKLEKAGALFALAVLIKPQALIFTPVLLFAYWHSLDWRRVGKSILWGLGTFIAGILPFSFVLKPWWIIELYAGTLMSYPYATLNAFNLYALTLGNWKLQTETLLFLTYQEWGIIFIGVTVGLALYFFLQGKHYLTGLTYYLALILISTMFLFGAKMHERYWFPALALTLALFLHLKDRRVLSWFLGLSICQFLNVAYTLNSALEGTTAIPAQDGVLLLVSFASLILFGYLLKIGYDGFITANIRSIDDPEKVRAIKNIIVVDGARADSRGLSWKLGLTRKDWLLMIGLTIIYGMIAFYNLGSTKAPETIWEPAVAGESFYVDFGSVREIERINSYSEIGTGKLKLEFAVDEPDQWSNEEIIDVTYTKYFTWDVLRTEQTARYVRITVQSGSVALKELAFYELNGEQPIPIQSIQAADMTPAIRGSIELLFDEPENSHYHPTFMHGSYFDEIYHPRTAYEHIHNIRPYENTHPPLGKLIIAVGIKIFGMNPFGWRIMGTLLGILMIPIMYVFGKRLFGSTEYAFMAAFLFTFDFMHFAQTRIGTIDTYGVFFIILMYYFMYRYMLMSFYREPLRRTLVPLFFSGLFFGIGAASKWIVLYGGAGLAVLFFASLYRRYREYEIAGLTLATEANKIKETQKNILEEIRRKFVPYAVQTVLWCIPLFVIIPAIIYSASFIPYMTVPGEGFSLENLIGYQTQMWSYHSKLIATHGFSSPWWEWPLMIKPIWFYSGRDLLPDGQVSSIVSMGNPAVWWLGTIAVIATIILTIKRRDKGMIVVITAFLSQYVPWMLVTRLTFIYHFFAMVPFLVLCLVYIFRILNEELGMQRKFNWIYMGIVAYLFLMFYPVLSGMVISERFVGHVLRWFPSWFF